MQLPDAAQPVVDAGPHLEGGTEALQEAGEQLRDAAAVAAGRLPRLQPGFAHLQPAPDILSIHENHDLQDDA